MYKWILLVFLRKPTFLFFTIVIIGTEQAPDSLRMLRQNKSQYTIQLLLLSLRLYNYHSRRRSPSQRPRDAVLTSRENKMAAALKQRKPPGRVEFVAPEFPAVAAASGGASGSFSSHFHHYGTERCCALRARFFPFHSHVRSLDVNTVLRGPCEFLCFLMDIHGLLTI